MMTTDIDYYTILQVSPDAEREVIDAAYRQLMRKYHPDVAHDEPAGDAAAAGRPALAAHSRERRLGPRACLCDLRGDGSGPARGLVVGRRCAPQHAGLGLLPAARPIRVGPGQQARANLHLVDPTARRGQLDGRDWSAGAAARALAVFGAAGVARGRARTAHCRLAVDAAVRGRGRTGAGAGQRARRRGADQCGYSDVAGLAGDRRPGRAAGCARVLLRPAADDGRVLAVRPNRLAALPRAGLRAQPNGSVANSPPLTREPGACRYEREHGHAARPSIS